MEKIFFAGDVYGNNGPSNVNKELKQFLPVNYMYIQHGNVLLKQWEVLCKTIVADKILYSGLLKVNRLSLMTARVFHKKVIYLMHGCVAYEQGEVNHTPMMGGDILEKAIWEYADKILCVSAPFAEWFKQYRPKYSEKVGVLINGIPWDKFRKIEERNSSRDPQLIILTGGGRRTKCNLEVIKAVAYLNEHQGYSLRVRVFGASRTDDDSKEIAKYGFVIFMGNVSQEELIENYKEAGLFIANSMFEPFSLSVLEALLCGCDILVSRNIGASSVLKLEKTEMIENCFDFAEIAEKMTMVLRNHNSQRILADIDRKETSYQTMAEHLEKIFSGLEMVRE